MFSREQMQRAIEDALKQMEGVALELYRRGREEAREELAEANARRTDLRTALEWANEGRDRLREQLAAKHSECPDCADYAERSGRFAEQADQMQRERDEAQARVIDAALIHADLVRERDEARASVADAYRRGAEAMREACARWMSEREGISQWVYDDALSALPIPEEP
jgi:siroheme synthase (precorrin-2 oxidase/ferrochelatase)